MTKRDGLLFEMYWPLCNDTCLRCLRWGHLSPLSPCAKNLPVKDPSTLAPTESEPVFVLHLTPMWQCLPPPCFPGRGCIFRSYRHPQEREFLHCRRMQHEFL